MFQIMNYIHQNENDSTKISLIFSNKTEKDILLKDELTAITEENENINVYHTLTKKDDDEWKGDTGYIDQEMVQKYIDPPEQDVVVMYCGRMYIFNIIHEI